MRRTIKVGVQKTIALFRGINVGGRHRLPMKELKDVLEGLGCLDVKTYIQSGNATFSHDSKSNKHTLAGKITAAINTRLGFAPQVWLFTEQEWQDAINNNPFPTHEGKTLHFFFLEEAPKHIDITGLEALKAESESFLIKGKVFYLYAPDGIGRSKLAEKFGKFIPTPMTARNWNTIEKLAEMIKI